MSTFQRLFSVISSKPLVVFPGNSSKPLVAFHPRSQKLAAAEASSQLPALNSTPFFLADPSPTDAYAETVPEQHRKISLPTYK